MKVNNLLKSALVALFLCLLSACGGSDEPTQEEDGKQTIDPVVCTNNECKK